jgi:hypothetical protein
MQMRPTILYARLSLVAIATAAIAATPAMANADIVYLAGTGEVAESGAADTGADYSADTAEPAPVSNGATGDVATTDAPQPKRDAEADMLAMGDRLADPDLQDGVAYMAEKMGETMMRLPVGKFASAIEKARPGTVRKRMRDNATLADLAGRNAEDIPAMIGKESRTAMKMMSGFTKAFASMMPEFEKLGREMETTMADVKAKRR